MKNFQVSVVVLLALIGAELAMMVVKLPTATVEAQLSRAGSASNVTLAPAQATPVYIVDRNGDATTVPVRVVDRAGKDATLAVRWGDTLPVHLTAGPTKGPIGWANVGTSRSGETVYGLVILNVQCRPGHYDNLC